VFIKKRKSIRISFFVVSLYGYVPLCVLSNGKVLLRIPTHISVLRCTLAVMYSVSRIYVFIVNIPGVCVPERCIPLGYV
jgi:hypothetical protein